MPTRILTRAQCARLLTMDMSLLAVEEAFAAHGRGDARMPVKVYLPLPEHAGDFRAMPAWLPGATLRSAPQSAEPTGPPRGAAGVKWVNSHPQNPARHGLPSVMGVYILSDPETARPLAIMDATLLTAYRTGAAAGVATKYLLGRTPRTVGFIGCGVQARYLLSAHRALFPDVQPLMADLVPESAARFAAEAGGRAVSLAEAAGCDVVCTATPSRQPVVDLAWAREDGHINAMGADAPGKQELQTALTLKARVFVDDMEQAGESGEVNVPLHHGDMTRAQIAGTLGEVIAGKRAARPDGPTLTIFDSTGLAVQDVALARRLLDAARAAGVGIDVPLVEEEAS